MKRCALSLLLACPGLAILLLAASCASNLREPVRSTNSLTGVIEAEIQSDHGYYDFGEPVRVRVTLKNVSRKIQVLGNETGPVADIRMQSYTETREWSQEHPNDVKRLVTLKPGESYVIEWIVTLTERASYGVTAWWADSTGFRVEMGFGIYYGVLPTMGPMP